MPHGLYEASRTRRHFVDYKSETAGSGGGDDLMDDRNLYVLCYWFLISCVITCVKLFCNSGFIFLSK